jgi:hypothetical protein
MGVLELYFDEDPDSADVEVEVTAKPAERATDRELDLLLEDFKTADDNESRKAALYAMLRIARGG